jgi:hypothetical protein
MSDVAPDSPGDGQPASAAYSVAGDLHLTGEGGVEGWVWSRERPDQRLIAEILVDDTRIGATVAARPRRDLAERGIGDGAHGFGFCPPAGTIPAHGPVVVTARERRTGQIFARIVRDGAAINPRHEAVIDAAQARIGTLWAGLEAVRAGSPAGGHAARLRSVFEELSIRLAVRARGGTGTAEIAVAYEQLRRQYGALVLPLPDAPALSLVLQVGADAAAALGHLHALAPALREIGAEVVVVDDGTDPLGALLPALAANIVYLRAPAPRTGARTVAEAVQVARGRTVALLEPEPGSATALVAIAECTAAAPRAVVLGPSTMAAAARVGFLDRLPPARRAPARLGLMLALDRDLLREAGGLDPAMSDGAGLDCADLWLRCRLLGARALGWTEPPRAPPPGRRPPAHGDITHPQAAHRALTAFRDRWRRSFADSAHA